MTSRRRFMPASIMAAALALAACGGSSDEGATDTVETAATPVATEPEPVETDAAPVATEVAPVETEPAPVETEPAPVETEPEPVATEPVTTEPVTTEPVTTDSVADGSCLVGEWIVTEDELNGFYDSIEGSFPEGPAPTFDIAGNVLLTFTETDYIYVADFDLTLDVVGQSGIGDTTGTVTGEWDVVDGLVVTTLDSSDLAVSVTIGGVTLSGTEFANGLLDSAPINDAAFDCAGPTINFQAGVEGVPGHEVLLTPA